MKNKLFIGVLFVLLFGGGAVASAQTYTQPGYPSYPPSYYPQPTPPPQNGFCPQLTYNLYRGLSDYYTHGQVTELQRFLATRYGAQAVTGYFGTQTYGNVAQFQREQGVYPVTGGVGPLTRAAIARACGGQTYPPYPNPSGTLSITNVSGPNSLSVGQQGTWSITTNAVQNSYVSVSVRWGDENVYPVPYASPMAASITQQNTFSHSYQQAGTYTITFTATDSAGHNAQASATVQVSGGTVCGMTQSYPGNPVYCPPQGNVSAYPQSGPAPLSVTFTPGTSPTTYYAVDFGDGQNAYLLQGSTQHTYYVRGTYTARFTSDMPCLHQNPQCMTFAAQQVLGTATITVY